MTTLSVDQRWLLLQMGGWEITWALSGPDGVTRLMQSRWGSSGGHSTSTDGVPGAPRWIKACGWDTSGGAIHSRAQGGPQVRIKAAEINRYAAQLPDDVKAELSACRNASTANAVVRYRHCHCGDGKRHAKLEPDRICPPSAAQEQAAADEYWRIRDWEKSLLRRALGFDGQSHCAGDQLELFGANT